MVMLILISVYLFDLLRANHCRQLQGLVHSLERLNFVSHSLFSEQPLVELQQVNPLGLPQHLEPLVVVEVEQVEVEVLLMSK